MKLTKLFIVNIKSFRGAHEINLSSNINVFIGANNSGKSTILNCVNILQGSGNLNIEYRSYNTSTHKVEIFFENPMHYLKLPNSSVINPNTHTNKIIFNNELGAHVYEKGEFTTRALPTIPAQEPNNLIYPYLSKRKVDSYSEVVNLGATNSVTGKLGNLPAKIARISNPGFLPAYDLYKKACDEIIGFSMSAIPSKNGMKAGYIIKNFDSIFLEQMGEGVGNLLGIIIDLCLAENKIFLIEEPENDIHPKALKALLSLIEEKSANNQFFISTHSNIVTKYLGANSNAKIFKVSMSHDEERIPVSAIKEVANDPAERISILEELGYEFHDYEMWGARLFLEEASCESILNKVIIPLFVPELKYNLKTFSCKGVDQVRIKFDDFDRLFVYMHQESIYKNRSWIIVDSGDHENQVVEELRKKYVTRGWNKDCFLQFSEHDFEKYYPERFQKEVDEIFKIKGNEKWEKKKQLCKDVLKWAEDNIIEAKQEFAISAIEVIEKMKAIASQACK